MKTQTKQLIALIAVLAAVLAVYAGLRLWNNAQAEEEAAKADTTQALVEMESVEQVTFTATSGEELTFTKEEESWTCENEPDLPVENSRLEEIEYQLCQLEYLRALEEHDELSAYGLDPAAGTISASDAHGNTVTVSYGSRVNYEDVFYALIDGQDVVYTISSALVDAVSYEFMDFAQVEVLPELSEAGIKSITLTAPESELTLNKLTEKKQEIQKQDSGEVDEEGNAVMEEVTVTVEIYHWSLADGSEIPEGNETLTSVLSELSSLAFSSAEAFRPTDEELSVLGLDDTATVLNVECMDGTVLKLILSAPDAGGTNCYVRVDGSDLVHLMTASSVDSLLAMTAETLTTEATE